MTNSMQQYRKKPIVIHAVRWDGEKETWDMLKELNTPFAFATNCRLIIHTLEGNMYAEIGDYIIQGIEGEWYPCKASIFVESYEVVE